MSDLEVVRVHPLKTDHDPFDALFSGSKTAEYRRNDRDFQIGDQLHLRETHKGIFTGRTVIAVITHMQMGYGIPRGYAMLSLRIFRRYSSPTQYSA
jgi:hypothetical protein